MDDNELDRLFGKDIGFFEEELEDNGTTDKESEDETSSDEPVEEKTGEDSSADTKEDSGESEDDGDESHTDKEEEEDSSEDVSDEKDSTGKVTEDKRNFEHSARPSTHRPTPKQRVRREPEPAESANLRDMIPLSGRSILAIALAAALVIMAVLVIFLPAFRVRNTQVEGNVVLSEQEILKTVGLEYDAHLMSGVSGNILDILRLDYGKTEERIKKENPYIEDIRITVKIPSTVKITVKERSKVCYIRTPDGYAALDTDGIVLELSSSDARKDVRPVICGLNVKYAEMGKKVKIENMNDYKKAIIVLGAILAADNASVGGNYSMFENTSEVRILPSGYIFLTIYSPSGNLTQIKLNGTESIGDNMAWLLYVFNSDAFDKITADGALDMTGEEFVFDEY